MLSYKDIVRINATFSNGELLNKSALEYALAEARTERRWTRGLAHLMRGIICGHAFHDGNKRTAAFIAKYEIRENNYTVDDRALTKFVLKLAKQKAPTIFSMEGELYAIIRRPARKTKTNIRRE